jgi:pimeloyl-ACP methyl ester carboxylesterase
MRTLLVISLFFVLALSSCKRAEFNQEGMANDHFFLINGGQKMPVTVGGNLDSEKMLVVIHGGPGGSAIVYRDQYTRDYVEKEFAMVYWDQRFAGGTQGNTGDTHISAFREDLKKLIQLLKSKYGKNKKIYLFGHSWGGFLAPYFLIDPACQELVNGWIQIGGAHNYLMNDSLTREMLIYYGKEEINAGRNVPSWQEMVSWSEANDFKGRTNAYQLNRYAHQAESLMPGVDYSGGDVGMIFQNKTPLNAHLYNSMSSAINGVDQPTYTEPISENLNKITVPALLLWGKYDFVCPPGLADDILANAGSKDIQLILFEKSGHSPMANEPETFWTAVINWVRRN